MKSAYELAMERLEKQAPAVQLSDDQKQRIAEIESVARAKTAEQELFLHGQIAEATAKGEVGDAEDLKKQLAHELRKIADDAESKKAEIRKEQ